MKYEPNINNRTCNAVQKLLGSYVDNTLSGRDVWEVERHLAACSECASVLELTRRTISALHSAQQLDTSNDFMANLHGRLDSLGEVGGKRSPGTFIQDMLEAMRGPLVVNPLRTFSVSAAAIGAAVLLFTLPGALRTSTPAVSVGEAISQENLDRHVAVTASNPFDDPVAAKLEAESTVPDAANKPAAE